MAKLNPGAIDARLRLRIEKLLALTGSPNEHEAASAAAKAQDLLLRHHLRVEDISAGGQSVGPPGIDEMEYGVFATGLPAWRASLAEVVARTSLCVPLHARRRFGPPGTDERERLLFVGRPEDLDLARHTLDFLTAALLTLADLFAEEDVLRRAVEEKRLRNRGLWGDQVTQHLGSPAARRRSFLEGATDTVRTRLEAEFDARTAGAPARALVIRREEAIADFIAKRHPRSGSRPPVTFESDYAVDAYAAGQAEAQGLRLHPDVALIEDAYVTGRSERAHPRWTTCRSSIKSKRGDRIESPDELRATAKTV